MAFFAAEDVRGQVSTMECVRGASAVPYRRLGHSTVRVPVPNSGICQSRLNTGSVETRGCVRTFQVFGSTKCEKHLVD